MKKLVYLRERLLYCPYVVVLWEHDFDDVCESCGCDSEELGGDGVVESDDRSCFLELL